MFTRFRRLLCLLALYAGTAVAGGLPPAVDFSTDVRDTGAGATPVLVFFMSPSCPYCREVENLYLEPMHARGHYRGRLLIRTVNVDSAAPLTDFSGRRTTHGEFADGEGVSFTPVVRIYGAGGQELVPQLLGYTTPDFYSGYLEQAIEQALARARPARTAGLAP